MGVAYRMFGNPNSKTKFFIFKRKSVFHFAATMVLSSCRKDSFNFTRASWKLLVEYYLHWTTTFEISFSGSSDTNHDSLL